MKTCTKCGEEKDTGEFSPDKRRKSGLIARCKACRVEDCRDHREANREKVRESARKWAGRHASANAAAVSKWRKKNPFAVKLQRSRHAAKRDGYAPCVVTIEELKAAWTGKCEICGVPELELTEGLHMDHDHETAEFRGFLCGKCNRAIGLFNDNEEVMINALHYIMASQT